MSTLFLILGVILITYLAIRGIPIFYCTIIAGIFILATAGMDVIQGMTKTYAFAFGNYVVNNFFVFVLGAIFGKIVELSGAANSIADFVVGKLGTKWVIPAIIIAGGQKQDGEKKKQPPFLLALIPMAILIAALGLLKGVPTAVGQTVGIVAALIFYIPYWRLFNWDVSNI